MDLCCILALGKIFVIYDSPLYDLSFKYVTLLYHSSIDPSSASRLEPIEVEAIHSDRLLKDSAYSKVKYVDRQWFKMDHLSPVKQGCSFKYDVPKTKSHLSSSKVILTLVTSL